MQLEKFINIYKTNGTWKMSVQIGSTTHLFYIGINGKMRVDFYYITDGNDVKFYEEIKSILLLDSKVQAFKANILHHFNIHIISYSNGQERYGFGFKYEDTTYHLVHPSDMGYITFSIDEKSVCSILEDYTIVEQTNMLELIFSGLEINIQTVCTITDII